MTRNLKNRGRYAIDPEDAVLSPIFMALSGASVGVIDAQVLGTDLLTTFTIGGGAISFAWLGSLAILLIAALSNGLGNGFSKPRWDGLSKGEQSVVAASVAGMTLTEFLPAVNDVIMSHSLIGLTVLGLYGTAYFVLSYLG